MPQVRLRAPSRDEQLKLRTNPFAPIAYTKYSHLLIDSHMNNHNKRILSAKPRVDMGIPESAVKCVKTRAKYYSPARIDLFLDTSLCSNSSLGSLGNSYRDYNGFESVVNRSQSCITKTGKQTKLRNKKETNKPTSIPWKHTTKSECLGQKTNFPSLVSSVCASQLVTRREQGNVKYKHIQSKVKQLFERPVCTPKSEECESVTESNYSSDPDHQSDQSDEELNTSQLATRHEERNVNLGETFNLDALQISDTKNSIGITSQEVNIESTEVQNGTMKLSELEPEPIIELVPIQDELDLEYLKLKRSITEECVKLQIFTSVAILKVCEKITGNRTGLDPKQVGKMIGQILRELEIA